MIQSQEKNRVGLTAYHMYRLTSHKSEKLYKGRGWQVAGMESFNTMTGGKDVGAATNFSNRFD